MKKVFLSFLFVLFLNSAVWAVEEKVYIVKNNTPQAVIQDVKRVIGENPVFDSQNNIIYSDSSDFYYVKTYKINSNSEIYVYANNEDVLDKLNKLTYKIYLLNDKMTIKQYNNDFVSYANNNNLSNANVKTSKKSNDKYNKYNPYSKPLKNKIVAKHKIQQNGIVIVRNEVVPKVRVKDKARAYEYLVTNNTGKAIVINKVASQDFIGLTQIAAYCMIPNGKSFIPVYGLVYGVQTDIEKNRFTRPHPVDETIQAGDTMRILALSKKTDDANADFYFTVNNKQIIINLDPRKAEKL